MMSKIAKVEIPLHVGDTAEFTKTVTETDEIGRAHV